MGKMKDNEAPLPLYMVVSQENGNLFLELRKRIRNLNTVKAVIHCALNEFPIIVQPSFTNKMNGICTLLEKGILEKKTYKNGSSSYEFLI